MDLIEARHLASGLIAPLGVERVRIEEALGRVLAERIVADRNLPAEPRSRLDGFALRSTDVFGATRETPVFLSVAPGCIAAGHNVPVGIQSRECIRILTGAALPQHADAVAPQEEVEVRGENLVLKQPYAVGSGVVVPGEDVRKGEFLLSEGEVLTPTRLALIVALGHKRLTVYRRPQVALLATGDEVKTLGAVEKGPFTYCNNMHLLSWLTQLQGGIATPLGVAVDEPRVIAEQLQDVRAELVITTGGMGKGDRDFIVEAWQILGVQMIFREINLIPGRSTALGVRGGQVFLGVPGNPWAAQVVFDELAIPMLRRCQGLASPEHPLITAILQAPLKKKPGFFKAIRGTLDLETAPPRFSPAKTEGTSIFNRVKDCFAYILLKPHVVEVAAGSEVQVRLRDFPLLASPLLKKIGSLGSD